MKRKLTSNMEDYLECILVLRQKNKVVRVRDISRFLSVKMPSVTSALNSLSKRGYVVHEKYGYVDLTDDGEIEANKVLKRHKTLTIFFTNILNIPHNIAEADACSIEHLISKESFDALTKLIEFIEKNDEGSYKNWLFEFKEFLLSRESSNIE